MKCRANDESRTNRCQADELGVYGAGRLCYSPAECGRYSGFESGVVEDFRRVTVNWALQFDEGS